MTAHLKVNKFLSFSLSLSTYHRLHFVHVMQRHVLYLVVFALVVTPLDIFRAIQK